MAQEELLTFTVGADLGKRADPDILFYGDSLSPLFKWHQSFDSMTQLVLGPYVYSRDPAKLQRAPGFASEREENFYLYKKNYLI